MMRSLFLYKPFAVTN